MFNSKKFKKQLADAWSSTAPVFHKGFTGLAAPATSKMLDKARIEPGFNLLDVGCGTGSDVFLAAQRTGPTGHVTGIDIAPGMIEVALANKQRRSAANTDFQVMDAEKLDFKRDSFDSVICRWALATVPDRHKSLKEVMRVLKPGGVFSVLCLGRQQNCKFITIVPQEIFRIKPELITVEDGGPGAFDFGVPGALEAALNAAGYSNIHTETLTVMITLPDGDTYWNLVYNGIGSIRARMQAAGPQLTEMVKRATIATAESYAGADGIRLPIEMVLGRAEKAKKGRRAVQSEARVKTLDEVAQAQEGVRTIAAQQLQQDLSSEGTIVLDVRTADEFSGGRIPGALNVPRASLESAVGDLVTTSHKQIVVCSQDGKQAKIAGSTLNAMGYEGVVALEGGFAGWVASGGESDSGFSSDW